VGGLEVFSSVNSNFYVGFVFFKFHSISKCVNFKIQGIFLFVKLSFELFYGFVVCRANKHTYSNTHLFIDIIRSYSF
jgi:hypothetical protein